MGDERFDLFGNPVRDRKGRPGRPRYEVTERNRNKVKLLLALGWSVDRIANAIQASKATLHRYFRNELKARDQMRDRLDAERALSLAEAAASGNVGAHRQLQAFIDRNDRMEVERKLADVEKRPALGKKQETMIVARDVEDALALELEAEAKAMGSDVRH